MKANFLINSCPAITCAITEDRHNIVVSIFLSEIGTNYLNGDPSRSLRDKYAGTYQSIENIPEYIREEARDSVLSGRGSFDIQAAKHFGGLPSTCNSNSREYYGKIRRRVEDKLRKTMYMDEILECALKLGVPLTD